MSVTKQSIPQYNPFIEIAERLDRNDQKLDRIERLMLQLNKSDSSEKKYIKIAEAAEHVGLAVQTVYRLCSEDGSTFPHIKRHKRLLFLREDLDKWLETGRKGQ